MSTDRIRGIHFRAVMGEIPIPVHDAAIEDDAEQLGCSGRCQRCALAASLGVALDLDDVGLRVALRGVEIDRLRRLAADLLQEITVREKQRVEVLAACDALKDLIFPPSPVVTRAG